MGRRNLTNYALCGAAALLAGCGGTQPSIGVPGTMPQVTGLAPGAPTYRVLYSFKDSGDGRYPQAGLLNVNGKLYGTTVGGDKGCDGTVYRITTGGSENVLHCFGHGDDGRGLWAELIDMNGTLYGTTAHGGKFNKGTVFSITTTGKEKVLYSFRGLPDGANPQGALVSVNGMLYGTTSSGGIETGCGLGCGTVYEVSTAGAEHVLHAFKGGSEADLPESRLLNVDGTLYGTTYLGGGAGCARYAGCGTVFSVTTDGTEKIRLRFNGDDGENPVAGLINVNGLLFGTTGCGGAKESCGTAYTLSKDEAVKVLHRFNVHDGGWSPAGELLDVGGTFYGATAMGGSQRFNGTVYRMSGTGEVKVLHDFAGGSDGLNPVGTLIEVNGTLYGTTYHGGGGGSGNCCGTVFALTL